MKSTIAILAPLALSIAASEPEQAPSRKQIEKTLSELSWLAGSWRGEDGGMVTEEIWMAPAGGLMLGINRIVHGDDRPAFFEYLRIEARKDGVCYVACPMGNRPTPFPLKESGADRAVFENSERDFPRRISYSLQGKDRLLVRLEGTENGKPKSGEWIWSRVK